MERKGEDDESIYLDCVAGLACGHRVFLDRLLEGQMETKQILIDSIENGSGRVVRVQLQEFKGKSYVDIRTWLENVKGEWIATPKGLTLSIELLPQLIAALKKADEEAEGKE